MKNSIIIDGKQFDLPDDLVKQFKEQLNFSSKKEEVEQFFLECLNGCSILIKKEFPDSIFYVKNDVIWMEYDSKKKYFHLRNDRIWVIFEIKFGLDDMLIKSFTQSMVEKYLKLSGVTTSEISTVTSGVVEKHLKLSGV